MNPLPIRDDLLAVARRIVWFEPPEVALHDPVRFMAYAAARATHADMRTIRAYVSDDEFREALDGAPPGIIDARSWAYWQSKLGRWPPPPMPRRFAPHDEGDVGGAPSRGSSDGPGLR